MSETRYYVRVRGKVLGPFGIPQLRSMRDRGQFRPFHEVSADGRSWTTATDLHGLLTPQLSMPQVNSSEGLQSPVAVGSIPTSTPSVQPMARAVTPSTMPRFQIHAPITATRGAISGRLASRGTSQSATAMPAIDPQP